MSSPIHSFLFSPPPSPPRRSSTDVNANRGLTSFRSLLLPLQEHADAQAHDEKPRSPSSLLASPSVTSARAERHAYPAPQASRRPVLQVRTVHSAAELDAIAKAATSPIPIILEPTNVASNDSKLALENATIPTRSLTAVPRPVARLIIFAALLLSSVALLVYVPESRLPSLRDASAIHRLVLNPEGAAFIDTPLDGHQDTHDRDYIPPQIAIGRSSRLDHPRKAHAHAIFSHLASSSTPKVAPPLTPPRPIPASHELLAVQAWLLQSPFNTLPARLDAKQPIDAVAVTGFDVGPADSVRQTEWLRELEREGEGEVIVWYGMDGTNTRPVDLIGTIKSLSTSWKTPSLLPVATRGDLPKLNAILSRLGFSLAHPIVVINNVPISLSPAKVKELEASGELEARLAEAGWGKTEQELAGSAKRGRKLKQAKLVKKDLTELEMLLAV